MELDFNKILENVCDSLKDGYQDSEGHTSKSYFIAYVDGIPLYNPDRNPKYQRFFTSKQHARKALINFMGSYHLNKEKPSKVLKILEKQHRVTYAQCKLQEVHN